MMALVAEILVSEKDLHGGGVPMVGWKHIVPAQRENVCFITVAVREGRMGSECR